MKAELLVFVRIALYTAAGWLASGGWLPPGVHPELVSPATVEAVTGLLLGFATFVWYWFSRARAALKEAVKDA